jgi:hypothetical protein
MVKGQEGRRMSGERDLPSCVHLTLGRFLEFDVLPAIVKKECFDLDTAFVEGVETIQHGLLITCWPSPTSVAVTCATY